MKKAVVLGTTDNMAFAVGVVLLSIKKHSPYFEGDFIILHNGLKESDKTALNSIFPCKFIEYIFPDVATDNKQFFRYTQMAFSRYEIFNWLDEYEKIVWIDIDTLIQENINKLFEACTDDIALRKENIPLHMLFHTEIEGMTNQEFYFNSGVIIFTNKIPNYKDLTQWCYNKTFELINHLIIADQAVINLIFQEFPKIKVTELSEIYNCHPMSNNAKNAIVLHSFHSEKFWNYFNHPEWNKYYKHWIKIGGSKYAGANYEFIKHLIVRHYSDPPNPLRSTRAFFKFCYRHFLLIVKYPVKYLKSIFYLWHHQKNI